MRITTGKLLTDSQAARFFRKPGTPAQRQYEALRAYFVDQLPSRVVAARFDYSPGAFRVLCHQFRHAADKRAGFFQTLRPGPRQHPARDPVRELVVALRKRSLSVYDIQHELAAAGQAISINTLSLLLREEGFVRLPRRRDDDRPPTVRAEPAAVADVRELNLKARSFRTRFGGLFLFVPLMRDICLDDVVRQARLPSSPMIPAQQAVRSLLALKLVGTDRTSHFMNLVNDDGLALFAGLNVLPKHSYLASYSDRCDDRSTQRLMAAWFQEASRAGLKRGDSFDLDFHPVPTNGASEPLDTHDVSQRSRNQLGVLTFLARDAQQRLLCYAHAGIAQDDRAAEILRFVDFWQQQTGSVPAELVFDSRLTTYAHLQRLHEQRIHFITLRRRTRQMLGAIWSRPASAWTRIMLPALPSAFRTPKMLDEHTTLPGYDGAIRQVTIIDLGHEEPTVLLTNNFKISCPALVTRYAQRMLIENGIGEDVQYFHEDALSSKIGLKVELDLQITLMASTLYRLLAERVGHTYRQAEAKTIFNNIVNVSALVTIEADRVLVQLDKRAHNPFLVQSRLADAPIVMPWFGNKSLYIQFA